MIPIGTLIGTVIVGNPDARRYNITAQGTEWLLQAHLSESMIRVVKVTDKNKGLILMGTELVYYGDNYIVESSCFDIVGGTPADFSKIRSGLIVRVPNPTQTFATPNSHVLHRVLDEYHIANSEGRKGWLLSEDLTPENLRNYLADKRVSSALGRLSATFAEDLEPVTENEEYINLLPTMEGYI